MSGLLLVTLTRAQRQIKTFTRQIIYKVLRMAVSLRSISGAINYSNFYFHLRKDIHFIWSHKQLGCQMKPTVCSMLQCRAPVRHSEHILNRTSSQTRNTTQKIGSGNITVTESCAEVTGAPLGRLTCSGSGPEVHSCPFPCNHFFFLCTHSLASPLRQRWIDLNDSIIIGRLYTSQFCTRADMSSLCSFFSLILIFLSAWTFSKCVEVALELHY